MDQSNVVWPAEILLVEDNPNDVKQFKKVIHDIKNFWFSIVNLPRGE